MKTLVETKIRTIGSDAEGWDVAINAQFLKPGWTSPRVIEYGPFQQRGARPFQTFAEMDRAVSSFLKDADSKGWDVGPLRDEWQALVLDRARRAA